MRSDEYELYVLYSLNVMGIGYRVMERMKSNRYELYVCEPLSLLMKWNQSGEYEWCEYEQCQEYEQYV